MNTVTGSCLSNSNALAGKQMRKRYTAVVNDTPLPKPIFASTDEIAASRAAELHTESRRRENGYVYDVSLCDENNVKTNWAVATVIKIDFVARPAQPQEG